MGSETNPFVFGKLAGKQTFTNRKQDIKELTRLIDNRISTIIISPRRWGKSSLVQRVKEKMQKHQSSRKRDEDIQILLAIL